MPEMTDAIDWIVTTLETVGPGLVACAFGVVAYITLTRGWYVLNADSQLPVLLPAVVTVSAIAVGFLGTLAAILASLAGSRPIKRLQSVGMYQGLIAFLMKGVWWSLLCAVYSCVLILFGGITTPSRVHFVSLSAWIGIAAMCVLSTCRIAVIFAELLRKIT